MKGLLLIAEGQYQDAAESFEKVLEKKPDHALAHQGLGQVFLQMKQYDKAEDYLRKAIALGCNAVEQPQFVRCKL